MAAFQLAMSGIKVLLLEAGRMLDPQKEYKTMEWPYKDMRRHRLPVGEFALSAAEYRTLDRPFGLTPEMEKYKKVMAYSGNHFTRDWIVNEKEHPITGTPYAWVRARVLGGKTNLWGRVSLRFSDLDLKAKSHDGFGDDWPIGYADIAPYYDKVDTLLGISGTKENIPHLPDGIFQRPLKLNCGEVQVQRAIAKMGRKLIPGRAGVTTDGVAEQRVPGALHGPRPLRPRVRSQCRVPLAGRADLPGARHRQPHGADRLGRLRGPDRRQHEQGDGRARHRQEHQGDDGLQGPAGDPGRVVPRVDAPAPEQQVGELVPTARPTRRAWSGTTSAST